MDRSFVERNRASTGHIRKLAESLTDAQLIEAVRFADKVRRVPAAKVLETALALLGEAAQRPAPARPPVAALVLGLLSRVDRHPKGLAEHVPILARLRPAAQAATTLRGRFCDAESPAGTTALEGRYGLVRGPRLLPGS